MQENPSVKAEKAKEVAANAVLAVALSPSQSGRNTPQGSQSLFSPSDGENSQATLDMIDEVISSDNLATGLNVDSHTMEVETASATVSGITSSNKEMSMNSIANVFVLLSITFVSHLLGTA